MPIQTLTTVTDWRVSKDGNRMELFLVVTTPQGICTLGPLRMQTESYVPTDGIYQGLIQEPKESKPKLSAKKQKRLSMKRETATMEDLGGRRQKGSGAIPGLKGDGRVRNKLRVEHKYTRNKSYQVKQDELGKVRGECTGLEIPIFVIDFLDPQTNRLRDSWTMIETHHFKTLEHKPVYATDIDSGPSKTR